ncbi:AIPR family protein [Brachyspira hyodysenteriae]|nr:AIPR family protein [Brachyspira hyodysenteriae]
MKEFFNLVCDNDRIIKSIFYDNVRDYQGDTIVNKEIANTMLNENESKYFGLYHNGVTIVAKTLKKTGENITLENFQIVNGCQTSHIIAKNFNKVKNGVDKMFIPVKLIATENNDIINSVIKATNRHNEVKTEAFESLKDFHKELEEFYNSKNQESNMPIYYERRSKQYIYNDKIERFSIVTLSQQIRTYLSMFEEIPQSVHRYYGELLSVYGEKK